MKRYMAWITALLFYATMLPWNTFATDYWNINANDLVVKSSPHVDVRAYGTITFGVSATAAQKTANANAIKAAIDNVTGNGATILLPPGIIYIDGGIVKLNKDRIHLKGMGEHATEIYFDSGVAITMSRDTAAMIVQCSISDLSLVGQGTANKVGIRIVDADIPVVQRVSMTTVTGNTSIGLQLRGRDLGRMSNLTIVADKPISIEDNPNHTIDIDLFHFTDIYLLSNDKVESTITVDNGVNVTNTTFDGYQAWVGGNGGFYMNSAGAASGGDISGLSFVNVRWESGDVVDVPSPRATVTIIPRATAKNIKFQDCTFGSVVPLTPGAATYLYGRSANSITLHNVYFSRSTAMSDANIAYDFDSTCNDIAVVNSSSDVSSGVTNIGTLTEVYSTGRGKSSGLYSIAAHRYLVNVTGASQMPDRNAFKIGGVNYISKAVSLDNNASDNVIDYYDNVAQITVAYNQGSGTAGGGVFVLTPTITDQTAVKISGDNNCVAGVPAAGQVGVYRNDGTAKYILSNKLGDTRTFLIQIISGN